MEKKRSIPLIYILGMPIIFIIANLMAKLHITILGSPLYFSVLLYPLTYFISGLIIKKSDYHNALRIMAISLIAASFALVLEWALFDKMNGYVMIYAFISFLICQLIFIYIYAFLIEIGKDTYMPVFLLIALISILDNAFFGILVERECISLSILIRIIYTVAIPVKLAKKQVKDKK